SSVITAKNNTKSSSLVPAFTAAGQATDADIIWALSGSTDLLVCTQVTLRGPNGATKVLKPFNVGNTGSASVLDLYSSSGPGTYTLQLQEKSSGCGGKNQNARISSATMTVEKPSTCN
ncbi:MAG TPA: hypothetical protein VJ521_13990, partial [Acidobacteriota bacterium]|nr:hypothetical protein [Acidobacteriota bacterium]